MISMISSFISLSTRLLLDKILYSLNEITFEWLISLSTVELAYVCDMS